jgi:hypothetical protein
MKIVATERKRRKKKQYLCIISITIFGRLIFISRSLELIRILKNKNRNHHLFLVITRNPRELNNQNKFRRGKY